MQMTCPQCNAQIVQTQRFCRYCGYRLDHGVQDYTATETLTNTAPPVYVPDPYSSGSAPWMMPAPMVDETKRMSRGRRRRKFFFFLSGLVLSCALAGGVIYKTVSDRFPWNPSAPVAAGPTSYLGIEFGDGDRGGAFIDEIATENGPADQAGLIGGDLIIEANGQPIRSNREMRRFLASTPPRTRVLIKVLRDGQVVELVLVTGAREDFAGRPGPAGPRGFFGINPGGRERVRVPEKGIWGVQLNDVITNGPADIAGIREGDIVIEFDSHPIRTSSELIRRIRQTDPYETVNVKVVRNGEELLIPVKMGRND